MKTQVLFVAISSLGHFFLPRESTACVTTDLVTPKMTEGQPAAGKRVRQVSPEYRQSKVYHSLYLPTDWVKGKTFPGLVEYTGNQFPAGKGSGEVKNANVGYGRSGGEGFN